MSSGALVRDGRYVLCDRCRLYPASSAPHGALGPFLCWLCAP